MSTNSEYIEQHTARLEDFFVTRRKFLSRCGMGFGALSLAGLLGQRLFENDAPAADATLTPLAPKLPHFPGKAKRVIHIFAQGAPSQVDTWDPKPVLTANQVAFWHALRLSGARVAVVGYGQVFDRDLPGS